MKRNPTYQDTSWMFARPIEPPTARPAPVTGIEPTHRPAESSQIRALVAAAWVIGASAALIGLMAAFIVIYLAHKQAPYVWALIPLALIGGVITGAILTIRWTHQAAVRAWVLEDIDRRYLIQREEEDIELRRELREMRGGQGDPDPARVRVEFTQPLDGQARQTQIADLDATTGQLKALADGLLRGAPFAESTWTGQGRPFSRGQFSTLRAEFIRRGWADWRHPDAPAQGAILTSQGKAVLRSFASETAGPLPYQRAEGAKNA